MNRLRIQLTLGGSCSSCGGHAIGMTIVCTDKRKPITRAEYVALGIALAAHARVQRCSLCAAIHAAATPRAALVAMRDRLRLRVEGGRA